MFTYFIRIAENAFNANNDNQRAITNGELKNTFDEMKCALGSHKLVSFHSVSTRQKAENSITHYKDTNQKLFDLISAL